MITLSVVVPATDAPVTLDRCLTALRGATDPPGEIVVVTEPVELSAAGARNAGGRSASGDVLVFVDADVEVHADVFVRLRAAYTADTTLVAVCGSYDDSPSVPTTVSAFRNLLHHHVHHRGAGSAETFWSGLGAIRRAEFVTVGGFDEGAYRHPSIEDIELGHRLRAAGAPILFDPAIQGTHLKTWTLGSMLWTDLARRGIPWVALQLRERRMSSALNLGWRHRVCALAIVAGVIGAALGRPFFLAGALAVLVAVNYAFYRLLVRRQGPLRAIAGVGLHAMHYLVAAIAVPVGVATAVHSEVRVAVARRRALRAAVETSLAE